MNENLLKALISILEDNQIPKKELRFKLLKQAYMEDMKVIKSSYKKLDVLNAAHEVQRLYRIGAIEADINAYINSL